MTDTTTTYLGLELKNPLVVSPSPLCRDLDNIKKMEDAGAAAIVLHSLFEEQFTLDIHALNENLLQGTDAFAESLSYFPDLGEYKMGPDGYLEHLRKAKEATKIPIIGSLNGVSQGGWTECAKKIEEAGADAIELNVFFIPTSTGMDGAKVESLCTGLVREVSSAVTIPVAVKIGPNFSALANLAKQLTEAGARGAVLFNRFYQSDLDLKKLAVVPKLHLTDSSELRLRLRWAAILYGRLDIDLAITGGVHTPKDLVKAMMAGASVAMMTSALLKHGIGHLTKTLARLDEWMERHEYESVRMMRGSMSQKSVEDPAAFERANYMKALNNYVPSI